MISIIGLKEGAHKLAAKYEFKLYFVRTKEQAFHYFGLPGYAEGCYCYNTNQIIVRTETTRHSIPFIFIHEFVHFLLQHNATQSYNRAETEVAYVIQRALDAGFLENHPLSSVDKDRNLEDYYYAYKYNLETNPRVQNALRVFKNELKDFEASCKVNNLVTA